ncbi:hypothetical protein ACEUZ9_004103 [Paracoccus litorisediminis]|uniref:hypothetical protein n=1 Tax=Paracoccus litorisediminis TaxID=2006130 RepID=UPI00373493AE
MQKYHPLLRQIITQISDEVSPRDIPDFITSFRTELDRMTGPSAQSTSVSGVADPFKQMVKRPFHSDCVRWPARKVDSLIYLQDEACEITRDAFLPLVDSEAMREIEANLGYDKHLAMADDYHVTYWRHEETGIAFFKHSAIEHVFATAEDIEALEDLCYASDTPDNAG